MEVIRICLQAEEERKRQEMIDKEIVELKKEMRRLDVEFSDFYAEYMMKMEQMIKKDDKLALEDQEKSYMAHSKDNKKKKKNEGKRGRRGRRGC